MQPTQTKRNLKPLWIILIIIGVLFMLCAIGGLAVSLSGNKPNKTVNSPAVIVPTTQYPQAGATTAEAKVIYTLSSSGIKKTAIFTVPAEWTLDYTFDCKGFGQGNFQVFEFTADASAMKDVLANDLDTSGKDSTPVHNDGGKRYLQINSQCKWSITVKG